MKQPFDIATYVEKTTKASGVPLRITSVQVLQLLARLLSR